MRERSSILVGMNKLSAERRAAVTYGTGFEGVGSYSIPSSHRNTQ